MRYDAKAEMFSQVKRGTNLQAKVIPGLGFSERRYRVSIEEGERRDQL